MDPVQLAGLVSLTVSIALMVTRLSKMALPIQAYIPLKWRWLPDAIFGTAGWLSLAMPAVSTVLGYVECCMGAILIFGLAAARGMHPDVGKTL